jgi:hypothetical protein
MTQLISKRKPFSSPDQIDRMQSLIIKQWAEVSDMVETRQALGQESLMSELKLVPDIFLPLPVVA